MYFLRIISSMESDGIYFSEKNSNIQLYPCIYSIRPAQRERHNFALTASARPNLVYSKAKCHRRRGFLQNCSKCHTRESNVCYESIYPEIYNVSIFILQKYANGQILEVYMAFEILELYRYLKFSSYRKDIVRFCWIDGLDKM